MGKGTHTPQKAVRELKKRLHQMCISRISIESVIPLYASPMAASYRVIVRYKIDRRSAGTIKSFDVFVHDILDTEIHGTI